MPNSTVIKWLHRALTALLLLIVVGYATIHYSDVYRYYLDTKQQGNPREHLKKRTPFMVADTGSARITGYGSHVNVTITGRIYSFTNSDLFYAGNVAILPVIDLNATGVY
ncbi:hypothetical protein [Pantoea sp.]|uniref:hypothetical protein n=1 Tax=Pantoea sp. TaxID=69393 RepID=UPI0028A7D659|nr:hypothetical protein [Pantoea sp.]